MGSELVESRGGVFDEFRVDQSGMDDLSGNGVGECDIGADVDAEPHIRPLGRVCASGVDGVHLCAIADSLGEMVEEDGVGVARVGTPQDDEVCGLDLFIRRRSAACS